MESDTPLAAASIILGTRTQPEALHIGCESAMNPLAHPHAPQSVCNLRSLLFQHELIYWNRQPLFLTVLSGLSAGHYTDDTPTWNGQLLHNELHPWWDSSQRVLHTVVEQEWVQRQAARVDDGCYQILGVMEERQGTHVPAERHDYFTFNCSRPILDKNTSWCQRIQFMSNLTKKVWHIYSFTQHNKSTYQPKCVQVVSEKLIIKPQPKVTPKKQALTAT